MIALRKRPLDQIGREHLALCLKLSADPESGIGQAAKALSRTTLQRACADEAAAAAILCAVMDAHLSGAPVRPYPAYLFHASLVAALMEARLTGPLLDLAGQQAASNLIQVSLEAIQDERFDFARLICGPC